MTLEDQVAAYRSLVEQLRAKVVELVTVALATPSRVDDAALAAFLGFVVPVVEGGQAQTAALTAAFLTNVIEQMTGEAEPVGVDPKSIAYTELRNGVDPMTVYTRPFITARKALSDGKSIEQAMSEATARLESTATADLQIAERKAALQVIGPDDRITGFRRVLRPGVSKSGSCGLCVAASTQRYGKEDLLPIHARCHCVVMPIFKGKDPGLSMNEAKYTEITRQLREEGVPADRGALARVRVSEHGELGPMLTNADDHFTGPAQVA